MSTSTLIHLNCGYCHAPIVEHDLMALKLCNHRLTEKSATARADAIQECVRLLASGSDGVGGDWEAFEAANALEALKGNGDNA